MTRILMLMSDTGGGHRAVAEALRYALAARHGDSCSVQVVDGFREYSPYPFNRFPDIYGSWIRVSRATYRLLAFTLTDSRPGTWVAQNILYPTVLRWSARRLSQSHADVIVCLHPWFVQVASLTLRRQRRRPPLVVVCTELGPAHTSWYMAETDLCCVASESGLSKARHAGLPAEKVRVTGFVVHPRFSQGLPSRAEARRLLGMDPELPALLLVGGGDGIGALLRIVEAIDARGLRCQLLVVAGRNAALRAQLQARHWRTPVRVYPFVENMPTMMAASDVLVSKAGPNTIAEACTVGLPMVLYDAIPAQETPNVAIVRAAGAGTYAPTPDGAARTVAEWLGSDPERLQCMSRNARGLSRPQAAWEVADLIWQLATAGRPYPIPAAEAEVVEPDRPLGVPGTRRRARRERTTRGRRRLKLAEPGLRR